MPVVRNPRPQQHQILRHKRPNVIAHKTHPFAPLEPGQLHCGMEMPTSPLSPDFFLHAGPHKQMHLVYPALPAQNTERLPGRDRGMFAAATHGFNIHTFHPEARFLTQ